MILFALKYWKYIGLVLGVLSLVTAALVYRASIFKDGVKQGLYQCEMQKKDTINDRIDIRKEQDSVMRSNTNDEYINSLREGKL